jgi:hypothetical protein
MKYFKPKLHIIYDNSHGALCMDGGSTTLAGNGQCASGASTASGCDNGNINSGNNCVGGAAATSACAVGGAAGGGVCGDGTSPAGPGDACTVGTSAGGGGGS